MAKKTEIKTKKNTKSVREYIAQTEPESLRSDGKKLVKIFKDVTGWKATMWGESIVGFGEYHYKYESGREGDFLATGFSLRKSGPTIYIMPGYADYSDLMEKLGPHKLGKSCLYLKRLSDVDEKVLIRLIKKGVADLKKKYPMK